MYRYEKCFKFETEIFDCTLRNIAKKIPIINAYNVTFNVIIDIYGSFASMIIIIWSYRGICDELH